jgi:hypothetical protein
VRGAVHSTNWVSSSIHEAVDIVSEQSLQEKCLSIYLVHYYLR